MTDADDRTITVRPIGRVVGGRDEAVDDRWDAVASTIELDPEQLEPGPPTAWPTSPTSRWCSASTASTRTPCAGAPATHGGGRDWPSVGILAQRAKDRPNRIGVTVCRVVGVGPHAIEVTGLDAVDGTPVLDVKPYLAEFGPRGELRQPAWSTELMAEYW